MCIFQGGTDLSQLKKLASYPGQEGAGQLGDIDEDDEVPGKNQCMVLVCSISISIFFLYF